MNAYYLAVDIGASSGRHVLGWLEDGRLRMEEVYRFGNGMERVNGHLCWDTDGLFGHVKAGMARCRERGRVPSHMGIDTWGVDFVLLDGGGRRIGDSVGYRDHRTNGMYEEIAKVLSPGALYERTGIQRQPFNTLYQLAAIRRENPESLESARSLLMMPDYFNYLLTGVMSAEYTNATTTQLVGPVTKDWDWELIRLLRYPERIFNEIKPAGTVLGGLAGGVKRELGMDLTVVLPATHDTGSAVLALPSSGETIYLSSGTWSLMGIELREANLSRAGMEKNFTNEGGYDYRFRYLKNIMGLWMIQSLRRELGGEIGFGRLSEQAMRNADFPSRVDVNDERFFAPDSMIEAIRESCERSGQRVPSAEGELAAVVYLSLADCYAETAREIETITGREYGGIHIIGGGCRDGGLNRLTAEATGKTVYAGPAEATAAGNLLAQMIAAGEIKSLEEARKIVRESCGIGVFGKKEGEEREEWK
jgi:rhamnulokinase